MFNPNEAIQSIQLQVASLHQNFQEFINFKSEASIEKVESDAVEAEEAAAIVHLGMDRFYAIHKKTFNSIKRRKKLLFSKKELMAYMAGEKISVVNSGIDEAENFRIARLKKKSHLV